MTDQLERLLERLEEEKEEVETAEELARRLPGKWRWKRLRRPVGRTRETGQEEPKAQEREESASRGDASGRTEDPEGDSRKRRREDVEALRERGAKWPAVETLTAREKQREEAAEGLYRKLLRRGQTAERARRGGQTAVAENQSDRGMPLTIERLDRVVRRDSRRYDGGMELY